MGLVKLGLSVGWRLLGPWFICSGYKPVAVEKKIGVDKIKPGAMYMLG